MTSCWWFMIHYQTKKNWKNNALMPNYKSSSSFVWYSILFFPYVGGKALGNYSMLFLEQPIRINFFKNIYIIKSIGWLPHALFPRCDRKGIRWPPNDLLPEIFLLNILEWPKNYQILEKIYFEAWYTSSNGLTNSHIENPGFSNA
jgi:hypothetical protein